MTVGDDRHEAFVAGYELGLALRCDQDTAQADHEARHARVRPMVLAMVADLHRRGSGDHEALQERRRQHQIDALQRNQAAARPWPPETAPLSPHALFGQTARQRVNA
jgi:hypothetical protein